MDSFKNLVKAMGLFLTKMQNPLMYTLGSVHGVPAPAQGCALLLRSPVPELRPKALRGCLTCIGPRAGVLALTVRESPGRWQPGSRRTGAGAGLGLDSPPGEHVHDKPHEWWPL